MKASDFDVMDKMTEEEAVEFITTVFTKCLIKKKFKDKSLYGELLKRIGALINCELIWQEKYEYNQDLMNYWPNRN